MNQFPVVSDLPISEFSFQWSWTSKTLITIGPLPLFPVFPGTDTPALLPGVGA